jgi:hypothetical protein
MFTPAPLPGYFTQAACAFFVLRWNRVSLAPPGCQFFLMFAHLSKNPTLEIVPSGKPLNFF